MDASFDPHRLIDRLEGFGNALPAVVSMCRDDESAWRPDPSSWSVLDIICHLVDEETRDFRARVLSTLEDPSAHWEPIDPVGWADTHAYANQDLDMKVNDFVQLRAESVRLLRELESPDWSRAYRHPKIGELSAGYMLSCWCAHDALHLRQMSKRFHQLALRDGTDDKLEYAGTW
jgi:hypothetical protein